MSMPNWPVQDTASPSQPGCGYIPGLSHADILRFDLADSVVFLPPQSIAANGIFSSEMRSGTIQATAKRIPRRA